MFEPAPEQAGFDRERLDRITQHLQRNYIDSGKIAGCQTLVSRRGQLAYYSALGQMDRERERPMADDTIFRIFSMTKPITSVALMTLYEQGYFQLNDPVHRVIPEWRDMRVYVSGEGDAIETRPAARPITFRHILSHQSGLSYGGGLARLVGAELPLHPADAAYVRAGRCASTPATAGCTPTPPMSAAISSKPSRVSPLTSICRRRSLTRSA